MKTFLKQISEKAIELGDLEFTQDQTKKKWIGFDPAYESEIKITEERLGIELPPDFKEFLLITNGFSAPNVIEPTFETTDKIDFLKNIDSHIIQTYNLNEIENIGKQLEKSICIGGINEEQYFLLVPPNSLCEHWKYWKFANWLHGEEEYKDLTDYFKEVLNFIDEQIQSK